MLGGTMKDIFKRIFEENAWGSKESRSGEGSDMFVVKPEPRPRDLIAEAFEASARDD